MSSSQHIVIQDREQTPLENSISDSNFCDRQLDLEIKIRRIKSPDSLRVPERQEVEEDQWQEE